MKFISFLHFDFISLKRNKILFFFLIVGALLTLDIFSKIWVEHRLVEVYDPAKKLLPGEIPFEYYRDYGDDTRLIKHDIVVVPVYFILTYVRNYDIGFSILTFLDNWMLPDTKSIVMKSVQLLAVLLAAVYFFYTGLRYYVPFTLIITGGLGNVIDRLSRGYVVDFIQWDWPGSPWRIFHPWPIFNVADTCVSVGGTLLALMLLSEFIGSKKEASSEGK